MNYGGMKRVPAIKFRYDILSWQYEDPWVLEPILRNNICFVDKDVPKN